MSESDFDLYLTLLSRFMRLTRDQRDAIADELRDHMESRLEDLVRDGMSREAAIRHALEEFGDATHLAHHFTSLARERRRRLIMRYSLGTSLAAALLVGFFLAFTPSSPHQPVVVISSAHAAEEAKKPGKENATISAIEYDLDTTRMKAEIQESTLGDSLNFIADTIQVDIILKNGDPNHQVKLMVHRREVSARTVLELLLDQVGGLSYQVRDGYIYITDSQQTLETRVYDCRDLLAEAKAHADRPQARVEGDAALVIPQDSPTDMLINVVTSTVQPESWSMNGGYATCAAFNGSLVIKQNQQAHRETEQLLDMLRKASKK